LHQRKVQIDIGFDRKLPQSSVILRFCCFHDIGEKIHAMLDERIDGWIKHTRLGTEEDPQEDFAGNLVDFRPAVKQNLGPIVVANSLRDLYDILY